MPVGSAKFDVNRCNESPLQGDKPDFWPVSKFNTGSLPFCGILPVMRIFSSKTKSIKCKRPLLVEIFLSYTKSDSVNPMAITLHNEGSHYVVNDYNILVIIIMIIIIIIIMKLLQVHQKQLQHNGREQPVLGTKHPIQYIIYKSIGSQWRTDERRPNVDSHQSCRMTPDHVTRH